MKCVLDSCHDSGDSGPKEPLYFHPPQFRTLVTPMDGLLKWWCLPLAARVFPDESFSRFVFGQCD